MKSKGIRILDQKEDKCISFCEILNYIKNGKQFYWSVLWLDVTPMKDEGKYIIQLEKKINKSEKGLLLSFDLLKEVSLKFFQEIEMIVIASKEKQNLHRYKNDIEMYTTCEIVIEMIDGGFWEVFSKDKDLIFKLKEKFKDIELLEPNFKK